MIAQAKPQDAFTAAAERILIPKDEIRLSDYVEQTVRLSPLWEAGRGPYSLNDHPYWRDILDAMVDPEVRMISILKSTRVGGTLAGIAAFLGISELDPAPAMLVTPDEPSGTELRDRLYDTALESDEHSHRVPLRKFWNTRAIDLQNMRIYLAWAGSKQRLRGRTCQRVFRTEIDVYPDLSAGREDPLTASAQRVKRSPYSLIYSESSPVGEDSKISKLFYQGNQMKWYCPCPYCNWFQELRFFTHKQGEHSGYGGIAGYKDDNGNILSAQAAMDSAYYLCERKCRIPNDRKNDMVRAGVWVPKGQAVNSSGNLVGTPDRSRRHVSAHLWTIVIPTVSLGSIAETYIKMSESNNLKSFLENELGVAPKLGRRIPEWEVIARRFQGTHKRGVVPEQAWFLTTGCDVQLHGVYWCTWAWGHMAKAWLIDWGYLRRYDDREVSDEEAAVGPLSSDIMQLDQAVLNRKYGTRMDGETGEPIPNPLGETRVGSIWVNIDANYRKNAVLRYCQQRNAEIIHAIRGDHHRNQAATSRDRFGKAKIDKAEDGQQATQNQELWNVGTNHYKFEIFERLQSAPPDQQFLHRSETTLQLPMGIGATGRDFMVQFCNDQPVEEPVKNTTRIVWKMRNPSYGRDYFHGSAYAFAAADMFLTKFGLSWNSTSWNPEPLEQPKQVAVR